MSRNNPVDERIKHKYFRFLKEARGQNESTDLKRDTGKLLHGFARYLEKPLKMLAFLILIRIVS
jgi:hypothetical protein